MDNQYVVFELDREQFGVNIGTVESIIKMQPIVKIPHSADLIEGITNLRGRVLPIVDLRKRFGLAAQIVNKDGRIIVVNANGTQIGMIVDTVSAVLTIADQWIEVAPAIATTVHSMFITGIAKVDQRLIIMLDLKMVFSADETLFLVEAAQPV
jgi:purine-binding chemotaxis protein CheW